MMYTAYEFLYFFFIYAFLGWVCEVIYAACKRGTFVNRGFLLGPVCPIYGFGVVAVLSLLEPLHDRPVSVFILAVLVTSALELLVGWLSEKLFHERLWDYSHNFMNIGGYICLTFSLLWGIGCMIVLYAVHPLLSVMVRKLPRLIGYIILTVMCAVMAADTIITVYHALKIEKRMKAIEELARRLEAASDHIGKGVSDKAISIKERAGESEYLQKQYNLLVSKKNIVHEHLFRSFDHLRNGRYKNAYERLKAARKHPKDK